MQEIQREDKEIGGKQLAWRDSVKKIRGRPGQLENPFLIEIFSN